MFTGIVEDLGEVEAIDHQGDFARIYVRSSVVTSDARPGDSICVSGVCLTVTGLIGSSPPTGFTADVMGETLRYSSLKSLSPGTKVNLERSVRLEDRLGGHLVQGHTDGTGTIQSRVSHADWDVVRVSLPASLARYVVHKGSITVDGVSLTVSALSPAEPSLVPPAPSPLPPSPLPPSPLPPSAPATSAPATSAPATSAPATSPPATSPPATSAASNPSTTSSPTAPVSSPDTPASVIPPPSLAPSIPTDNWFEISLIPETLKRTTLGTKQPGDEVNLEVDVIAKYVERLTGGTR